MNLPTFAALPLEIQSRTIALNDLQVHYLEAVPHIIESGSKPKLLILLHGFPEIAYSWRKIMVPLCKAGYHVVAPDQRGYGWTKIFSKDGEETRPIEYDDDLSPFRPLNMANDIVSLIYVLGYNSVEAVIGHDFGSGVAGACALIRPDLFKKVVMMSAPFGGAPDPPHPEDSKTPRAPDLSKAVFAQFSTLLAKLDPPRKHYTMYFSTREANSDIAKAPQGVQAFLRAYFHTKSADWEHNAPAPLPSFTPDALATLPHYYIMPLNETMPQAVGRHCPSPEEVSQKSEKWLSDTELQVYVSAYSSPSGFQGGLNSYRCLTDPDTWAVDMRVFGGKTIEVPAMFIAGKQDWGTYQFPGAAQKMKNLVCAAGSGRGMTDEDFVLIDGAGHWVQQEKPDEVVKHLLWFLAV